MLEEPVELNNEMLTQDEYDNQNVADVLAQRRAHLTEKYEREIAAIEEFATNHPTILPMKRRELGVLRYML